MFLGLTATAGTLVYGYRRYRKYGPAHSTSMFLMQLRVFAQGAAIVCITAGMVYKLLQENVFEKEKKKDWWPRWCNLVNFNKYILEILILCRQLTNLFYAREGRAQLTFSNNSKGVIFILANICVLEHVEQDPTAISLKTVRNYSVICKRYFTIRRIYCEKKMSLVTYFLLWVLYAYFWWFEDVNKIS